MFYFVNPFSLVSPAVCTYAVPCVSLCLQFLVFFVGAFDIKYCDVSR